MADVAIVGAGLMGTATAYPLSDNGHRVRLVGTHLDGEIIRRCKEERYHPKLKRKLPEGVQPYFVEEIGEALEGVEIIVSGVNSLGAHWIGKALAPHIQRLRELTGLEVKVVNWWGESYLKHPQEMLALKAAAGPGIIQGQDPDVAALGAPFYASYATEHKLPLILGVGASFLAQSQPGEVAERVRAYVEAGKKAPGFALYLCNVDAQTPAENLRAAIKAVSSGQSRG